MPNQKSYITHKETDELETIEEGGSSVSKEPEPTLEELRERLEKKRILEELAKKGTKQTREHDESIIGVRQEEFMEVEGRLVPTEPEAKAEEVVKGEYNAGVGYIMEDKEKFRSAFVFWFIGGGMVEVTVFGDTKIYTEFKDKLKTFFQRWRKQAAVKVVIKKEKDIKEPRMISPKTWQKLKQKQAELDQIIVEKSPTDLK
ncbi:9884_t:CDS:2 [Ambispora leptoticha]|uniref:9884_t:CDS:1 n=1 Tax=Ambispora leptoticha TaxID=144679 RepID=A0A9N9EP92_9GLOM|nr:9884_t:CDS:2 [Ambispora leptoticha]